MTGPNIPYPPGPANRTGEILAHPDSYSRKQVLLLGTLIAFHVYFIAFAALVGAGSLWCLVTLAEQPVLKAAGMILGATCFALLAAGYFRRRAARSELLLAITHDEHPVLFGFISRLCRELGAAEPDRVFVAPDVNARVIAPSALGGLLVEPQRDLVIGLGLVQCTNLSEFKAVLAHELGHIIQLDRVARSAQILERTARELVGARDDWLDILDHRIRLIGRGRGLRPAIGLVGTGAVLTIRAVMVVVREPFWWLLQAIALYSRGVSREGEYLADLVAARAAGTDAAVRCLDRARFGVKCLTVAIEGLASAIDRDLYSRDLFYHQDRAASVHRHPATGPIRSVQSLTDREIEGPAAGALDHRSHPSPADREARINRAYIPAPMDERSAWILFSAGEDLREEITRRFYRVHFGIARAVPLSDPAAVQEQIDRERDLLLGESNYHAACRGRMLEPGDLATLAASPQETPWTADQIAALYANLFEGCRERVEAHAIARHELATANIQFARRPSRKSRIRAEQAQARLNVDREWFRAFDRRVCLVHLHMAEQVDPAARDELVERYRFQLQLQRLHHDSQRNFELAQAYVATYRVGLRGDFTLPGTFESEAIIVLRASWRAHTAAIREVGELRVPKLADLLEQERLVDGILREELVAAPPLTEFRDDWVGGLMAQLQRMRDRCRRLHHRSLDGLVVFQERVAAAWLEAHAAEPCIPGGRSQAR